MKITKLLLLLICFTIVICTGSTPKKEPPEKCASCHADSLAFKEWKKSDHANSLKKLTKDPNALQSCLKCHSSDYNRVQLNPWMATSDLPTLQTASNPVSCSSCHKHDSGIEDNLIISADKSCAACHIRFCGG